MLEIATILWISVALQIIAVVIALRLIPLTGRALAWTLLSVALFLMASRRAISLLHEQGYIASAWLHNISAESVALVISILMLSGVFLIRGMFIQKRDDEETVRKLSLAIEQNPSSTIITDPEGLIEYVNPRFTELNGYSLEEIRGKPVNLLRSEQTPNEVFRHLWKTLKAGEVWKGEFCNRSKHGQLRWDRACISPVKNEQDAVTHYVAVLEDITEQRAQEEALRYMALHDLITDLPNRALFHDRLGQALLEAEETGSQVSVLLLDLNQFKIINDTLGHLYGDRILREVAKRLQWIVSEMDTVARMSGDEFLVLLKNTTSEKTESLAQAIHAELSRPLLLDKHRFNIGVSIGYSFYPQDGNAPELLIQKADVAMYTAKHNAMSICRYDSEHDNNTVLRLELIGDLHSAAEKSEFVVNYQPRINVKDRRVEGVEALIRWRHPRQGMIAPSDFIPIAEETGNIGPITRWMIRAVCDDLCRLHAFGVSIEVSVNISAWDLRDSEFTSYVQEVLMEYGLDAKWITFEITESALMMHTRQTLEALQALKRIGIRIAIDDFGTGYSSMQHLKQLPVAELKIDKSFVMNMIHNDNDAVIVRCMIDLAHNLGLKVVAEGVENTEISSILEVLRCDAMQGYLYAHPMPYDKLRCWLGNSESTLGDLQA